MNNKNVKLPLKKSRKGSALLAIAFVISLALLAGAVVYRYPNLFQNKTIANQTPIQQPVITQTPSPKPRPRIIETTTEIGTPFQIGSFQITATSAKSLGNKLGKDPVIIGTQGKFLIVNFGAENNGKNAAGLSSMNIQVQDSMSRNYSRFDSMALSTSLALGLGDQIGYKGYMDTYTEINPGFKTGFSVIFEVAADSKDMSVRIGVPGGTEIIRIPLGF